MIHSKNNKQRQNSLKRVQFVTKTKMLNNRREGSFVGQVDKIARLTKKKLKVF